MLNTTGYSGYGAFGVDAGAITTGKYCGSASNIQAALNDLGYGPLAVDGNLGQKSFAAMDKFGRAVGVGAVQYATPAFCAALQKALAAAQAPPPPDPAQPPPQGQPPAQYPPPQGQPPMQYPPPAQYPPPPTGGGATGIKGWWDGQTPTMKYVMIGGGALLLAGIVAAIVMSGDDEPAGLRAAPPKLAANRRRKRGKSRHKRAKRRARIDRKTAWYALLWPESTYRFAERMKRNRKKKRPALKRNRSRSKKAEKWAWKHAGRHGFSAGISTKARIYEVMRRGGVDMTTAMNLLHTVPYRNVDMAVSLARGRSRTQATKSIALGLSRRRAKYVLDEAKRTTKKRRAR
jgi:hypothetical protein